jgi:hypothetical protein
MSRFTNVCMCNGRDISRLNETFGISSQDHDPSTTWPVVLIIASILQYMPVVFLAYQITTSTKPAQQRRQGMPVVTKFYLWAAVILLFIWQLEISVLNRIFLAMVRIDPAKTLEGNLCVVPPW